MSQGRAFRARNETGRVRLTYGVGKTESRRTEEQVTVALEGLVEDGAAHLRGRTEMVLELEAVREDGVPQLRGLNVLGPWPQGRRPPSERCRQQQRKPEREPAIARRSASLAQPAGPRDSLVRWAAPA